MKEDCYLCKAFNKELANKESGSVIKMTHLLDSCGMSNLILNMFKVLKDEIDNKEYKNKHKFFQKRLRTVVSKPTFTLIKRKRNQNLNNFNNRNAITKIRLSSHNFSINTTKWYYLQEDMKICKHYDKKEIENEILIIFSCNKYDNIWRKAFNNLNEMDNIKLQIGNKILKIFFAEVSLKALNIFGQILMRTFQSR